MKTVALSASLAALCAAGALSAARAADAVGVTISDKGCEPASVTVVPGKSVFKIRNDSKRAVEWEILKGVDVVEERENIIPGFTQTLTATLDAGDYQMTCGLLSNPKGALTVAAAAARPRRRPRLLPWSHRRPPPRNPPRPRRPQRPSLRMPSRPTRRAPRPRLPRARRCRRWTSSARSPNTRSTCRSRSTPW